MTILYDKTGASFQLDHKIKNIFYVRPMIQVVQRSINYSGDDFFEDETLEPSDYLIARDANELFTEPPVKIVDIEIKDKIKKSQALILSLKQQTFEAQAAKQKMERELNHAQKKLEKWKSEHRVICDLGNLLDGKVLYPLSVKKNPYHKGRDIPYIPKMVNARYLSVISGDFEKGQKWVCAKNATDTYGNPFQFFETEEDRLNAIALEFEEACEAFKKAPLFDSPQHTTLTKLSYCTLQAWVKAHPSLSIPADIESMRSKHEFNVKQQKREHLISQLQELDDPVRDDQGDH